MKLLISESKLNALVDAYNTVTGMTGKMTLDELAEAIETISVASADLNQVLENSEEYDVDSTATTVKEYTFKNAYVKNCVFPKATSIGNYAFDNSALTSLTAPLCRTVGNYACNECYYLKTIYIPACTNIGNSAFCGSDYLKTIDLGDVAIGPNAFAGSHVLETVSLGNASIGANAFDRCSALTSITLDGKSSAVQKSIANLGSDLTSLYSITFRNYTTIPTLTAGALDGATYLTHIYVPAELADSWKAAANWSAYASLIEGV